MITYASNGRKEDLAAKTESELDALLRDAFNALVKSDPGSHQRRDALASIENIQNELVTREVLNKIINGFL